MKGWGQTLGGGEEGRGREGGICGLHCPWGGKERQAWNPGCSHRAVRADWVGNRFQMGHIWEAVVTLWLPGIRGNCRPGQAGLGIGAQDREPFTKPGWVWPSRQPSRVAGESCGWSPAGREGSWGGKWKIRRLESFKVHSVSAVGLGPKVGCVALP